ncbi:unnamed protein product [Adineta steineri]|uniref:Uncharacterized protein n=1 Tax=Adineta steineri TaxID=433720 RepID=A0A818YYV0_9BILA|nr:unnamed protein product [Adineta steineri]CAF3762330.1 unnamed protein product [Adineta steineri]
MDALTKDGIYIFIGGAYDRSVKRGGVFEIYMASTSADSNSRVAQIQHVLEANSQFFFINTSRVKEALESDIFQRDPPNGRELDKKHYLIRENCTLRLSNPTEQDYLNKITLPRQLASVNIAERTSTVKIQNAMRQIKTVVDQLQISSNEMQAALDEIQDAVRQMPAAALQLPQRDVEWIMCNSYGRMAMAYQRARNRRKRLIRKYSEIFEFARVESNQPNIPVIWTKMDGRNSVGYPKFYRVKLKDKYKNMRLKKVLEVLQVYNSTNEMYHGSNQRIDGTAPLVVSLEIGRRSCQFMLSRWLSDYPRTSENQLLVSIKETENNFVGHTYPYLVGDNGGFSTYHVDIQRTIAQCIQTCLDTRMCKQYNYLSAFREDLVLRITEFLIVTQVVESNHGRNYAYCRTPGMNKLARRLLMRIATEKSTFSEYFDPSAEINHYKYPPIGDGGTRKARQAVQEVGRDILFVQYKASNSSSSATTMGSTTEEPIRYTFPRCHDMSDDSVSDGEFSDSDESEEQ